MKKGEKKKYKHHIHRECGEDFLHIELNSRFKLPPSHSFDSAYWRIWNVWAYGFIWFSLFLYIRIIRHYYSACRFAKVKICHKNQTECSSESIAIFVLVFLPFLFIPFYCVQIHPIQSHFHRLVWLLLLIWCMRVCILILRFSIFFFRFLFFILFLRVNFHPLVLIVFVEQLSSFAFFFQIATKEVFCLRARVLMSMCACIILSK